MTIAYAVVHTFEWAHQQCRAMSNLRIIHEHLPRASLAIRRCVNSGSVAINGAIESGVSKRVILFSDSRHELSAIEPQVSIINNIVGN
jgi:hypothetical protein